MADLLRLVGGEAELFDKVLDSVDIERAKQRWPMALTDHRPAERKDRKSVV